jgi:hypothetical protein
MAPLVLSNRRDRYADSARHKLAQVLHDFIEGRGGWIMSPLPLADNVALRFDVRSHDAAQVCSELGALGLAVRFVTADLKTGPSTVTELIREGHRLVTGRRMPAPCAVSTFEIALPDENVAGQGEGEIILECASTAQGATNPARRTAGIRTEGTMSAPMRCSRARPQADSPEIKPAETRRRQLAGHGQTQECPTQGPG